MCVHIVSIYSKHHIIRLYFFNFRYFYFVMFCLFWSYLPWHVLWSRLFWPYCKNNHVCVDKPTDKTKKKRRVKDGRDCEYEFILWSFLGELALEEMWTVSVYLCILLARRKIWEKKDTLPCMSWDNLRRKTVLNRNDIFYFIYSILYWYILVSLWCIISLDILYPVLNNKSNKCQFKSLYSYSGERFISDTECHDNIWKAL